MTAESNGLSRDVLVLYWSTEAGVTRLAIDRHLRVLGYSGTSVRPLYVNTRDGIPIAVRKRRWDAVVLHTTFLCMRWSHLFPIWKRQFEWIGHLSCPKIALPQDEYDHSEILDDWLYELGVTSVVSNFHESTRSVLYPITGSRARFVHGFTGYVDDIALSEMSAPRRHEERLVDIVYRATHLPYWFGSHGQLKHDLASVVNSRAISFGMTTDISTRADDVILGDAWLGFLASGRTVIGCESGSSVLDRRGEIRAQIQAMLREKPDLTFDEVFARMPRGWDSYAFFAVSPRHFEAVITRTCQVLVEGEYDGVLEPGRHYISLRRDYADLDDVLAKVRERDYVESIAERAFVDICESGIYSYRALSERLEDLLSGGGRIRRTAVGDVSWHAARLSLISRTDLRFRRARRLNPVRLVGRALTMPRGAWARSVLAARLSLRHRATRSLLRIARQLAASPEAHVASSVILSDLLRLGIIDRARAGGGEVGGDGRSFDVALSYDADRRVLGLTSISANGPPRREGEAKAVAQAVEAARAGSLQGLIWDHSAIGSYVSCKLTRARRIDVHVGDGGPYRFDGLTGLLRTHPLAVAAALEATLCQPPRRSSRSAPMGSSDPNGRK